MSRIAYEIFYYIYYGFIKDRCITYAAALSFSSMFSMVPFFIIVFTLLKGFGLHHVLAPMVLSNVSAGSQEIIASILDYVDNASFSTLGVVGLLTLFISIMFTLDYVEEAFNHIWGLEHGKSYHHKVRDYLIVILGIPVLITLAAAITTALQNQFIVKTLLQLPMLGQLALFSSKLVPYLIVWLAMLCLYKFIPNTSVKLKHAATGAIVAGTAWQVAQWAFIHFQIGALKKSAIYGTLSLLPVFMIWIFSGWIIVLVGMELVCYLHGGKRQLNEKH